MNDLISRQAVIEALCNHYEVNNAVQNATMDECVMLVKSIPSAKPWDIVKTMLKELEQKEERLYSDYCDATARLKAINKIAESSQAPRQKIDGIKPLAETEETSEAEKISENPLAWTDGYEAWQDGYF